MLLSLRGATATETTFGRAVKLIFFPHLAVRRLLFFIINFFARGGAVHPYAYPPALQAAESLGSTHTNVLLVCCTSASMRVAPQAPERLLYATNIFSKPTLSLAVIFRGLAIPILLQGVKPRPAAHAPVADVLSAP